MSTSISRRLIISKYLSVLGLIAFLCMGGCTQKPDANDVNDVNDVDEPVAVPHVEASSGLDVGVAAKVNDVNIMQEQIDALVEASLEGLKAKSDLLSDAFIQQQGRELEKQYIDKMVIEQLMDDEAQKKGITASDQEVQDRVTQIAENQTPKMTIQQFLLKAEASGESIAEYEIKVKQQLARDKLVESEIAGQYEITEEEALAYYKKNPNNFTTAELVKASHIVIRPIDDNDPNMKAEARARAEGVLKELKEGGDFAELAMDNSEDAAGVNGGDLGYFPRGEMEPPFEKVAFSLPVGKLSDVVETSYGYHIIKVTDRKEEEGATFEQVKAPLIAQLTQNKKTDAIKKYLISLKEKADIVTKNM
jgi:parvulin-like peptidyl-prolyl isomerase